MINIFYNFCELELTQSNEMLNKLKISKFTPETLENMIHVARLEDQELQKIDKFIENTLKLFPQLFPYIILKHTQSNKKLENARNSHNSKIQTMIEKAITNNNWQAYEIVNCYNVKKYPISKNTNNFLHNIDRDITFKNIEDEILAIIKKKFPKQFHDNEPNELSKIITAEIYLRTLVPEEYLLTGDFKKFKDANNAAIKKYNSRIVEEFEAKQEKGCSKEKLLSLLQKELLK